MNLSDKWSALFNHSSFYCYNKFDVLSAEDASCLARLENYQIEHFHPQRKKEFLLGRLCASRAHEIHFGKELLSIPFGQNRAPVWPIEILGSITHNQFWAGAAVTSSKSLLGLGIDFEVMGRAKKELSNHIRSSKDLKNHQDLSESELLTIIFSAKESLYKALYPSVKSYFGFQTAAVHEIDLVNEVFKIELISEISHLYGPLKRSLFEGRFKIIDKTCLTVLEIFH